jgi:hypothetical protein
MLFLFYFCGVADAQILNQNIEQVRYADQFPGADIGAQVMNAYANLPSNGGVIEIPSAATCQSFSTPIVFSKPIILRGQGIGTFSPNQTNYGVEPTCLQWTPTSGAALTIALPSSQVLSGLVLENFALHGSLGTASGVLLQGGSSATQLDNIYFRDMVVKNFYNGIVVRDNAYLLKAYGVQTIANGHNGWDVDVDGAGGLPSQLRFFDCLSLQNGYIGFNIVTAADSEFHGVTASNNVYGIVSSPLVHIFGGMFESNSTTGIWLMGPSSVVVGAMIPNNGSYGIAVSPAATHSVLTGVLQGTNTLDDVYIDPAAVDIMLLECDPGLTISGPNVGYTARTASSAGGLAGFVIVRINGTDYKVPYYN